MANNQYSFLNTTPDLNLGANYDFSRGMDTTNSPLAPTDYTKFLSQEDSNPFAIDVNQNQQFALDASGIGSGSNATGNSGFGAVGDWWNNQTTGDGAFTSGSMFGDKNSKGWLSGIASVGASLVGGYTGLQQLDLAKDQFAESKAITRVNSNNELALLKDQYFNRANNEYSMASEAERANMVTPEQKLQALGLKGL